MSASQGAGDHLQELSQQLQVLGQLETELEAQLQGANSRRSELRAAIDALGDLETESVVQVPVGGDTYVRARIDDIDEVIVALGADFAAEQTRDDAVQLLDDRVEQLEGSLAEIRKTLSDVRSDIQEVQTRAQHLRQQLVQQQRQQVGDDILGSGGLGGGLGGQD